MAKILVIEDNPTNMKLTCFLLDNIGHKVLTTTDAEAGIALARNENPQLILMDIQLPGMNGFAATTLLKHDSLTAHIPIIAVTALAMKIDREKSLVAGCDDYIAKPLRYKELHEVINKHLTQSTTPASTAAEKKGCAE